MSILKGHLEHFGLQELLQTLSQGARSGTLEINRDGEKVSIVFETGHITLVRSSTTQQLRLRSILLRQGVVSHEDLEQASKDHEDTGILLGRALIERGAIAEAELEKALRTKIEEELFDLFLWTRGSFEFFPEQLKSTHEDDIYHVTRIQVDPMTIVLEGLRQADEWNVIRQRIQDQRWILVPVKNSEEPAENNSLFKLNDGSRTIEEVLSESTLTRFDACTVLYRFLEEGWIREATHDEMLRRARDRSAEIPAEALAIYEALIESGGVENQIALLDEAADCAGHADTETQAVFLRMSVRYLREHGDQGAAWKRLQRLLILSPGHLEDLLDCWEMRDSIPSRKNAQIFDDLCKALRRQGEYKKLITILREAEYLKGEEGSYWLQLGETLLRFKDPEAKSCLENAIALSGKKSPEIALRAERSLRTMSPDHGMDEKSLEELLSRQIEIDNKKLQARYIKFGSAFLVFFFAIIQISTEWRAQGMLSAAKEIEKNSDQISSKITAAEAYERVILLHPWTFAAGNSDTAGSRIRKLIQIEVAAEKDLITQTRNKARAERNQKKVDVEDTLIRAEALIEEGSAYEARVLLDTLTPSALETLPIRERSSIRYPVLIESVPSGAKILGRDRSLIGVSPLTVSLKKEEQLEIYLEKKGCRPRFLNLSGESPPRMLISLVRSPLRSSILTEPCLESLSLGERVVLSGRDGKIRVVDLGDLRLISEHSVGISGHPAPILIQGNNSILALPREGRPLSISKEGEIKTLGQITHTPWKCGIHFGEQWILGDGSGGLTSLNASGDMTWFVHMGAPIEHIGTDASGNLLVIDAIRRLHTVHPSGEIVQEAMTIPGEPHSVLEDGTLLLTSGEIWSRDQTRFAPPPLSEISLLGNTQLYSTKNGWACLQNGVAEEHKSPIPSTCPPLRHSSNQELAWLAGGDGILRLMGPGETVYSEVSLGAAALDLSHTGSGHIMVTLSDGTLCDIEEQVK